MTVGVSCQPLVDVSKDNFKVDSIWTLRPAEGPSQEVDRYQEDALWQSNIATENGPFEDVFPEKNSHVPLPC